MADSGDLGELTTEQYDEIAIFANKMSAALIESYNENIEHFKHYTGDMRLTLMMAGVETAAEKVIEHLAQHGGVDVGFLVNTLYKNLCDYFTLNIDIKFMHAATQTLQ